MEEIFIQFQEASSFFLANKLVAVTLIAFKNSMIALSAVLFLGIVYVGIRINRGFRQTTKDLLTSVTIEPSEAGAPKGMFQKRWEDFGERLGSDRPSDWKLVVIEADKLLEDTFKAAGFEGEGIGDILRRLDRSKLANLDAAWQAHKVRNSIVHSPEVELTLFEARAALENFSAPLRELGVID